MNVFATVGIFTGDITGYFHVLNRVDVNGTTIQKNMQVSLFTYSGCTFYTPATLVFNKADLLWRGSLSGIQDLSFNNGSTLTIGGTVSCFNVLANTNTAIKMV